MLIHFKRDDARLILGDNVQSNELSVMLYIGTKHGLRALQWPSEALWSRARAMTTNTLSVFVLWNVCSQNRIQRCETRRDMDTSTCLCVDKQRMKNMMILPKIAACCVFRHPDSYRKFKSRRCPHPKCREHCQVKKSSETPGTLMGSWSVLEIKTGSDINFFLKIGFTFDLDLTLQNKSLTKTSLGK